MEPLRNLEGEAALQGSREQLRVQARAHVVAHDVRGVQAELREHLLHEVGLLEQRVAPGGRLVGKPEAEQVEGDAPAVALQVADRAAPVEAGRGEPVNEQNRRASAPVHHEDPVAVDGHVSAGVEPPLRRW
jgi:hypothetical protein